MRDTGGWYDCGVTQRDATFNGDALWFIKAD
jgi:hypothetical protein